MTVAPPVPAPEETTPDPFTTRLAWLCEAHGEDTSFSVGIGSPVKIRQLPLHSPYAAEFHGGTCWTCGQILAHYIAHELAPHMSPSCRAVELGCGVAALPSIAAVRSNASVLATDLADVIEITKLNARSNEIDMRTAALDWTQGHHPELLGCFDLVLAADVLSDASCHYSLLLQLETMADVGGAAVFVAERTRPGQTTFFEDFLPEAGWACRLVDADAALLAMEAPTTYSETFGVWLCWRAEEDTGGHSKDPAARENGYFWHNLAKSGLTGEKPPRAPSESASEETVESW
mmetsp:Transcript_19022/g.34381  ORF Transcript_19022/g.34381 Transcript_19022/m.34381 type:complete len:290 (-) Transcript_19022:124-993(-)